MMEIPYLELSADPAMLSLALATCNGQFVRGKVVTDFEKQFAALTGASHCITVGSGTDALFIGMKMLGVQPGDEVITPALSWISSAETISLVQAKPVFADVDPVLRTVTPDTIAPLITSRTRAVIAVHLHGQPAPVDAIRELCDRHGLWLIEDCAQAHLTRWRSRTAGTVGHIGAFSFYPTKNLGAWGDAGCILTDDGTLSERIRRFSNHGALGKEDHLMEGMNSRMDSLQAAILLQKLPDLEQQNARRRENARFYGSRLSEIQQLTLPAILHEAEHTFHIYAIQTTQRDDLRQHLFAKGIQTLVHYPVPLPFLPAYQHLAIGPDQFPVASQLSRELLSLPVHPQLTDSQRQYITDAIHNFFA